jgi:hypothetical protein
MQAVDTDLTTAYITTGTYNVTAGVGVFNGSYVRPFINKFQELNPGYQYTVVPYSLLAIVRNLVVNPMHSIVTQPIQCNTAVCDAYLLTGGLVMTTPWPPTTQAQSPMVIVDPAPATQIEFQRGIPRVDRFEEGDCDIFGGEGVLIAMRLCVAKSRHHSGQLISGSSAVILLIRVSS